MGPGVGPEVVAGGFSVGPWEESESGQWSLAHPWEGSRTDSHTHAHTDRIV